jgi:hypothetical protein
MRHCNQDSPGKPGKVSELGGGLWNRVRLQFSALWPSLARAVSLRETFNLMNMSAIACNWSSLTS